MDCPLLYKVSERVYDLRCAKDRNLCFNETLWTLDVGSTRGAQNRYLSFDCWSFMYLRHHDALRFKLAKALRRPASVESLRWMHHITSLLHFNRLIFGFIFRDTDVWKPLLMAWIAILPHELSDQREETTHEITFLTILLHSMCYWSAAHFRFARDRGLFAFGTPQCIHQLSRGKRTVMMDIIHFGQYLALKFNVKGPFGHGTLNYYFSTTSDGEVLYLQQYGNQRYRMMKQSEKFCGWPLCHRMQMDDIPKQQVFKKLYICKGCRLIKYCCRNHQKKHWKFIHSQQCRQY